MVICSRVAKTVLLACGLARAVEEKTRCIEWVCIYAYIHPHLYNDINVLLREAPVQAPSWEHGLVYAGLRGRLHVTRCGHKSVQSVGFSHIGLGLGRNTSCMMTCIW